MGEKKEIDILKTIALHSGIGILGVGLLIAFGFPLKIGLPIFGILAGLMLASGITWIKLRR